MIGDDVGIVDVRYGSGDGGMGDGRCGMGDERRRKKRVQHVTPVVIRWQDKIILQVTSRAKTNVTTFTSWLETSFPKCGTVQDV